MIPCKKDTPLIRSIVDAGNALVDILRSEEAHDPSCRNGRPSILIGCKVCESIEKYEKAVFQITVTNSAEPMEEVSNEV